MALELEWKLDDGVGIEALDSSGNDRHGTLVGGPAWITPGRVGAGALHCGENQAVRREVFNFGTVFSLSIWTRWYGGASEGYGHFIGKFRDLSPNYPAAALIYTNDGTAYLHLKHDGANTVYATAGKVNDGEWHWLCGIRNGNDFYMYKDNVLITSINKAGIGLNYDTLIVGTRLLMNAGDFYAWYNGHMDYDAVRIHSHALSEAERTAYFTEGAAKAIIPAGIFEGSH